MKILFIDAVKIYCCIISRKEELQTRTKSSNTPEIQCRYSMVTMISEILRFVSAGGLSRTLDHETANK